MWNIFVDACTEYISQFFKTEALMAVLSEEERQNAKKVMQNTSDFKVSREFIFLEENDILDSSNDKNIN
jgi:hypothetical protein